MKAARAHLEHSRERLQSVNSVVANLRENYKRTRSENDFKAALSKALDIVEDYGLEHPDSAIYFNNLAALYRDRSLHAIRSKERDSETITILSEAIRARQFIVSKTPARSVNGAGYLTVLADLYLYRYKELKHDDDLESRIKTAYLAVLVTEENHPTQARRLSTLGNGYQERYDKTACKDDLEEALRYYARSLHHPLSPLERIASSKKAAGLAMKRKAWGDAARYLTECLDLLPRVILRSTSLNGQMPNLKELSPLGPISASVFLRAGRLALESLQALEKKHSIMAGLVIDSRSDVSLLNERHPRLHDNYCDLRAAVAEPYFHRVEGCFALTPVSPSDMASKALQNEQNVK